jgi:hypothetical protein
MPSEKCFRMIVWRFSMSCVVFQFGRTGGLAGQVLQLEGIGLVIEAQFAESESHE